MKEICGNLTSEGLAVAVVASRFNSFLTEQLVKGACDAFVRLGGKEENLTLVRVPGAYELPLAAKRLAEKGGVQAVVCLGAVVDAVWRPLARGRGGPEIPLRPHIKTIAENRTDPF